MTPYQSRVFTAHDLWRINDLALKVYMIKKRETQVSTETIQCTAEQYAHDHLPVLREKEGSDHGLGYAILHLGELCNWLLIHWWAHQDIALGTLASADDLFNARFVSRDHQRFHACVWEHVVIDHERNAWVENMMTADPNAEAYLNDRLKNGVY
ncbi:MAG: hypothetical protein AAFX52_03855 [Pseudomonadota bacterium]